MISFVESSLPTCEIGVLVHDNCAGGTSEVRHRDLWLMIDLQGRHVIIFEALFLESLQVVIPLTEGTCSPSREVRMLMKRHLAVQTSDSNRRSIIVNISLLDKPIHIDISFTESNLPSCEICMLIDNNCAYCISKVRYLYCRLIPDLQGGHVVINKAF